MTLLLYILIIIGLVFIARYIIKKFVSKYIDIDDIIQAIDEIILMINEIIHIISDIVLKR